MRAERWDRIAVIAIIVGVALRAVWVLVLHPPQDHVYSDMAGYVDRAVELARGEPLDRRDAFYPPGTHLLLAVTLALVGPDRTGLWLGAYLWFALSSITPLLGWRFVHGLAGPAAAAIAAVLLAVWPLHIGYAGYFLSETPSLALLAAALVAAERARRTQGRAALAAGLLGGAALANRPQFALNLAVEAVRLRGGAARLAAFAGGAALVLALVIAHNSLAAGRPTGPSENGGLTFYFGHCDVKHVITASDDGLVFEFAPPPSLQRNTGDVRTFTDRHVWDQGLFYRDAFRCIAVDGLGHARVLLRSVIDMGATTSMWPQLNEPALRRVTDATNALYVVALPFVVAGALTIGRRRPELAPAARALSWHLAMFVPLALIVFGDPRFRTPYDYFGLSLAGVVIASLLPPPVGPSGPAETAAG